MPGVMRNKEHIEELAETIGDVNELDGSLVDNVIDNELFLGMTKKMNLSFNLEPTKYVAELDEKQLNWGEYLRVVMPRDFDRSITTNIRFYDSDGTLISTWGSTRILHSVQDVEIPYATNRATIEVHTKSTKEYRDNIKVYYGNLLINMLHWSTWKTVDTIEDLNKALNYCNEIAITCRDESSNVTMVISVQTDTLNNFEHVNLSAVGGAMSGSTWLNYKALAYFHFGQLQSVDVKNYQDVNVNRPSFEYRYK